LPRHRRAAIFTSRRVKELIEAGANIVGGCCGTNPDHIRAMARAARSLRHAALL
jgi:5-methyltetrahydrofolate--homocysteine methyltransferase